MRLTHHALAPGLPRAGELDAALYALGMRTTPDETRHVLASFDADRSGALDLGEFRKLVEQLRRFQRGEAPSTTTPSANTEGVYPGGWQRGQTEGGQVFHFNRDLGLTQWAPPDG